MKKLDYFKLVSNLARRLDLDTLPVRTIGTQMQWRLDHLIEKDNPNTYEEGSLGLLAEELKPHLEEIRTKVDGILAGIEHFKDK